MVEFELGYWEGFIAADGCVQMPRGRVSILLASKDKLHLKKFGKKINRKVKNKTTKLKGKEYSQVNLEYQNKKYATFLCKKGITPKKSLTLHIKDNLNWDFIRGVFDGDGSFGIYRYSNSKYAQLKANITSASKSFIKQLNTFFISEGLETSLVKDKNCTKIYIRKKSLPMFIDKLYNNADIFLERKKIIANKILKECQE